MYHVVMKQNKHIVWKIGYVLRIIGLIGTLPLLLQLVLAGPFAVLIFFFNPLGLVLLAAILCLAIGHYMVENWKNK